MPIPAHETWMKETALGLTKPRSSALKAVDEAIRSYWNAPPPQRNRWVSEIRRTFQAWTALKGGDFESSERNHSQALTNLHIALTAPVQFTEAENEAHRWYEQQRRRRMHEIFQGKTLRLRPWHGFTAKQEAKKALEEMKAIGSGGPFQVDREAVRKARERQQQLVESRASYRPNLGMDLVNPLANGAFAIDNMVSGGGSRGSAEGNFGMDGARAGGAVLSDLFGGDIPPLEIQSVVNVKETVGSFMPLISNVASGLKFMVAVGKYALAWHRQADAHRHGGAIDWGTGMEQAFQALEVLLERKRSTTGQLAVIEGADFAVRAGLSVVDWSGISGSVVGMVTGFAKLAHRLILVAREYRETRAARLLLDNPDRLDHTMFSACPLLGCYMLVCSDTSEIIQVVRGGLAAKGIQFGAAGWMDDVERMKREHVEPVLERAAAFIHSSPWEMPDMPLHAISNPGLLDKAGKAMGRMNLAGNVIRGAMHLG